MRRSRLPTCDVAEAPPCLSPPLPYFSISPLLSPSLSSPLPSSPFGVFTPNPTILLFKGEGPFSRADFPARLALPPVRFWKPLRAFGLEVPGSQSGQPGWKWGQGFPRAQ